MSDYDEHMFDCPADSTVHCCLVPKLKQHIADVVRQARADALEEAAKVAAREARPVNGETA